MACSRNQSYLSTCCQKMSLPYQVEKMIPKGVVLEVEKKRNTTVFFFFLYTSSACAHQYTLAQMHRGDAELSPVDKQMTDKWLVGTPPPGSIVIALWDCTNGISYREGVSEREREQGPCVSFYTNKTSASHRMWLLPLLSTVANLIALSIWVTGSEDTI